MRKVILLVASTALLALGVLFGGGSALAKGGGGGGGGGTGNACPKSDPHVSPPPGCDHRNQGGGGTTCDFANPPTGPISGIVGQVGEAIGDNQLGNLVVDIGCALQTNLGL